MNFFFLGTNLTIPKGTEVVMPTSGIHYDPEIFPDPERFDPERFSAEAVASRHPMAWQPFGHGPRNCLVGSAGMSEVCTG